MCSPIPSANRPSAKRHHQHEGETLAAFGAKWQGQAGIDILSDQDCNRDKPQQLAECYQQDHRLELSA